MSGGPGDERTRILLVEDEPGLVLTLSDRLASEGYLVDAAQTGAAGLEKAATGAYQLILLDVMLPGLNGFEVCRALRARGVGTPVIMLTARGQLADKVSGLRLGADDYVTKPFEMAELVARIEARLRRDRSNARPTCEVYEFGNVRVDFRRAEATREGLSVELSARELALLRYFLEHRGETLSRDELLVEVWGYGAVPNTRTVDVHVAWLRQKLETHPRHPEHILTVHGLGYKFVA